MLNSGVSDGSLVEDVLEGRGGVGEPFRAGEAEGELGHDKVRLEHQEAVIAACHRAFDERWDLTVAGSGRNVAVLLGVDSP